MSNLMYNAMRTPDGTVLVSRHRHDYVEYTDANGKHYMVDGGLCYIRRSGNGDEEDLSLTSESTFEELREKVAWGTYGPRGTEALKWVNVKDMDTDHIQAILANVPNVNPNYKKLFEQELKYRGVNE